ncbi:hypothetical protein ABIE89_000201 [Bradyrhizobium niftali]
MTCPCSYRKEDTSDVVGLMLCRRLKQCRRLSNMRERTKLHLECLTTMAGACVVNGSVVVAATSRRMHMSYIHCAPICASIATRRKTMSGRGERLALQQDGLRAGYSLCRSRLTRAHEPRTKAPCDRGCTVAAAVGEYAPSQPSFHFACFRSESGLCKVHSKGTETQQVHHSRHINRHGTMDQSRRPEQHGRASVVGQFSCANANEPLDRKRPNMFTSFDQAD